MAPRYLIRNLSFLAVLAGFAFAAGCASNGQGGAARVEAQTSSDEVGTRGVPQAVPQQGIQLPTWPQRFEVHGPEIDSFGFAVTQPGPVVVVVQAQGAPVVVSLEGPAAQPISQPGSGQVRLTYNVTPQDVQKSPFWRVQIRLVQPMPPQLGGRAGGTVMVQHPPVNVAQVQAAANAHQQAAQQQAAQRQTQAQQAGGQAHVQMEAAFQQRKAQFERQQIDRRATLHAQIQPQLDQLRSRMGMAGAIRSRGLEDTEGTTGDPDAVQSRRAPPSVEGQSAAQLPAFPQKFDVRGPETDSFGFAVTQARTVQVDVQAQGAPVIVTLQHLASPPLSRQGSGPISLTYQVTPRDVQKSALWVVKIRLVQPGAPAQPRQANGTVIVRHPPANPAVVQAQAMALEEQDRANRGRMAAEAEAQSHAAFQEHKARFERQQRQRQAAERAQNQTIIDRLRANPGGMIRSRAITAVIDRLNKNQGQPKDQVILYGRNFGTGGEVLFELAPNIRGTGIVEAWSDTVVVVDVPDASGLLQFDGNVFVSTGQVQSNTMPFRFVPMQEVREIHSTRGDISIAQPGSVITGPDAVWDRIDHDNTTFMRLGGSKGNDIFFPTARLQNGWVLQDIKPRAQGCGTPFCTGVVVADSRIGTDVPFFNVRWWYDALASLRYSFSMWIVGPRGVPDGILMRGPLQPVVPPGTTAPTPSAAPPQMTVVPANPALLPPVAAAPGLTPPPQTEAGPPRTPPARPPVSQPPSAPPQMTVVPLNPALLPPVTAAPGVGTSTPPGGASSGTTGSGTSPQQVPSNPIITSLSVAQAQPGDPVMINGSNFGSGSGEIHFVIANGKDVVAPAGAIWTDTQIFTSVPTATGLLAFNGQVYIKRATDQKMSNLALFRFEPTLEVREIRATMDRVLKWPVDQASPADEIQRSSANFLAGFKDNDVLFGNTRLKNGWVTDEAFVYCEYQVYDMNFCKGGAYVWEVKKGTDWPYLNVRWWLDPAPFAGYSNVYYRFAVRLVGPKGVPDGLVVP